MNKQLFLIFAILLFGFSTLKAQTVTPTPVALPTPLPYPSPSPTPIVNDTQNVPPENLQGIPQIAPNYENKDLSLPDLGRVGVDLANQKALSLREAITLALENNKDIELTRENVRGAEFDLQASLGVYEPKLTGQTYYEHARTPVLSFFGGGPDGSLTTNSLIANVGIEKDFRRYGSRLTVQGDSSRVNSNSLFNLVNPINTENLRAEFTQPLFRGRRFDQNRRQIEISKRNLSLTDTQFRQQTITIISNVQRAYWDLTYSLRNLQVQRDSVKDAKDQFEHNKRLVQEGQLAPIDIVAAETQVANFEQAVYDALNTVAQNENNLKNLISPNRSDPIWSASIVPVDPIDLDVPSTTLPEALDTAMQNRPELELNETQKEINLIDQKFYREQTRPQIDLFASYTATGASGFYSTAVNPLTALSSTPALNSIIGNVNSITSRNYPDLPQINTIPIVQQSLPGNLIGGYGTAFSNLFLNRYPTYRVGVNFNLPIFGNKTAKAQLGRSIVEGDKIKTQREQVEQGIQVDVRNALQTLRTAEARLRAASIARENSQKQYESEQRKLDSGQSDVYNVLDRQTALAAAKSNEIRAQTELNKAIGDLQRATGNSLKDNNIQAILKK